MNSRQLTVYWRFIKARATGITPCSYESVHGHDLEQYSSSTMSGMRVALSKCRCGTVVSHSAFGSCIENDARPELREKDYSATLIMLTVAGFIAATWLMEMFG